jgi:hypothetical protein
MPTNLSNNFFLGAKPVTQIFIKDFPLINVAPPPVFTSYTSFGANPQTNYTPQYFYSSLYVYEGRNVAFLIENNFFTNLLYPKMQSVVNVFDNVYDLYKFYTGFTPVKIKTYNNKATIASVTATCGPGCGLIGNTGIEIERTYWNNKYVANLITSNNNLYDQVLFYEFGRNFWDSDPQLWLPGLPIMDVAFAIFMRFLTMEKTGVQGAPFNTTPFSTFKSTIVNMLSTYITGPYNWNNTFLINKEVPNALNLRGAADLAASLFFDLSGRFGNLWLENIWKITPTRPTASVVQDIPDNFVRSCAQAVNLNLTSLFENYYKWPISTTVKAYLSSLPNYTVPELIP